MSWGMTPIDENWSDIEAVVNLYGSVTLIASTLFRAMSGGNDWADLAYPLAKIWWFFAFVYVAYIVFMVFGVLNVLTGVFVDNAEQVAKNDRHQMMREEEEDCKQHDKRVRELFHIADESKDGHIDKKEFEKGIERREVRVYLAKFGLHVSDAQALFTLFDTNGDGKVSCEEFTKGCLRVRGGHARAVDMLSLVEQQKKNTAKIDKIDRLTSFANLGKERLERIEECLEKIEQSKHQRGQIHQVESTLTDRSDNPISRST
jgi:hypothetical protein